MCVGGGKARYEKMFKLDFDPRVIGNKVLPDGTHKTGIEYFCPQFSGGIKEYIIVAGLVVNFGLRNTITEEQYGNYITELLTIPDKIQKILQDKERLQWFAAKYANAHDVFFVGRGIDYAISLEGSLKLKEISYIHSEAYAAGE